MSCEKPVMLAVGVPSTPTKITITSPDEMPEGKVIEGVVPEELTVFSMPTTSGSGPLPAEPAAAICIMRATLMPLLHQRETHNK